MLMKTRNENRCGTSGHHGKTAFDLRKPCPEHVPFLITLRDIAKSQTA